jgi:hypothetical protein
VPQEFVPVAMPGGKLAPHLAKKGVQGWRVLSPSTQLSFFNMDHPVVGGLEPHKVALRRAVWLAIDVDREDPPGLPGQRHPGAVAHQPRHHGLRPGFKSENSEYNPAKSKALLDMYGYVDRDGDGWREQPNGEPLLIEWSSQPDQLSRQFDELMKKSLDAIGVRVVFKTRQVARKPEGRAQRQAAWPGAWDLHRHANRRPADPGALYGPQAGQGNIARFKLKAFDEVYDQLTALPDGPERLALFDVAKRMAIAYAPYKVHVHQFVDMMLAQPWISGYRRPLFWYDFWHLVDVDTARRPVRPVKRRTLAGAASAAVTLRWRGGSAAPAQGGRNDAAQASTAPGHLHRPKPRWTRRRPTATTTPPCCWRRSWKRRCVLTTWRGPWAWRWPLPQPCPRSAPTGVCSRCGCKAASSLPTTRLSRAGRASWWRRTTSIRSSAITTRATTAATCTCSSRSSCPA